MDASAYLSTAERVVGERAVAERWADDGALVGYTVGGLAGHLARAVLTVDRYLERAAPAGEPLDAAGYFVRVLGAHDLITGDRHLAVRDRAAQEAGDGPDALAVRRREARLDVEVRLAATDGGTSIAVLDGTVMSVGAYLETRLVELVVHLDDLAVSVGLDIADEISPKA